MAYTKLLTVTEACELHSNALDFALSEQVEHLSDLLVDAGIKGILCFSPVNLNLPRHVVVQYVDLTSELQTLLYFMKEEEKSRRNND